MSELLSLRAYGRAISRSDGPSFRVSWSDDAHTLSWMGGQLDMDQFRSLSYEIVEAASESCARLMYGIQPDERLDTIRDDMSNIARGYSFVQEPRNGLADAYLELSSRACLDKADGLMSRDRWNRTAVDRYVKEEGALLQQIMLVLYLLGGQAPRSTELFSLECWNGPATPRSIYVHAGSMLYVTRHHKARQSSNQEFQVVRYLPRKAASLLSKYLVYIRPFTEMIRRRCLGQHKERRLLFASPYEPERVWKTHVLTKALAGHSKSIIGGVGLGVQVYRQLSIAITEKHVKQISKPFNRFDDKTSSANVEVVFAWQSGHRPLQRGITYGLDAAYTDSLQPALLRVYRWASEEWHAFLQFNSRRGAIKVGQSGQGPDEQTNSPLITGRVEHRSAQKRTARESATPPAMSRRKADSHHYCYPQPRVIAEP